MAKGVRNLKVKLIEDYPSGIFMLTKGLKGEAIRENDDEHCVIFRNVISHFGSEMFSQRFWIPKRYLKKYSLIDYFF